ncbi:MAG: efflux RND transporter periplasmic adaptor subunit [Gammaproteobacteria bacterium]
MKTNPLLLAAMLSLLSSAQAAAEEQPFTVEVTRGRFDVFVIESARLDARRSVTLASELPSNKGKIIWLVEEGTYVTAGDPVARFDPAPFEEDLAGFEREYQDGKAALAQAEAELQIQIRHGRETVEQTEHALQLARIKLQNLQSADQPLRISAAKVELQTAEIARQRAGQELDAQREMVREGFGNDNMLEEAAAIEREKRSAVELAAQRLDLLQRVILPAEVRQAELDIENRTRELESSEQLQLHSLAKQNNVLVRLRNQLEVLDGTRRQAGDLLARTEIRAPVSGFVVYKVIPVGNERRKAQVGDSVWNRHGFIVLPDMSAMVGHVNIREKDIGKLAAGQTVTLKPEAYPGLVLDGRVDLVGTLAADTANRDENFFQVRIVLDEVDPRLRPGMRAQASILTNRFADVLRVPIEAVFYEDGAAVCFVWDDDEAEQRAVKLGASDGEFVVGASGLDAGQQVLLTWPRQAWNRSEAE